MMQLRFIAQADPWTRELCEGFTAYVRILGLKSLGRGHVVAHFVDISTKKAATLETVRERLSGAGGVESVELTELAKGHFMGVVMSVDCKACRSLIESNLASFVSSAATQEDGKVAYRLFLNADGVPELLNRLSSAGVGYEVTEISPITEDLPLTSRQLSVLRSAMELGLYDYPRRITQDELAVKLGIRSSTLNEILRRAEKKILGSFLGTQLHGRQEGT